MVDLDHTACDFAFANWLAGKWNSCPAGSKYRMVENRTEIK